MEQGWVDGLIDLWTDGLAEGRKYGRKEGRGVSPVERSCTNESALTF